MRHVRLLAGCAEGTQASLAGRFRLAARGGSRGNLAQPLDAQRRLTTICLRTPKEYKSNNRYITLNKDMFLKIFSGFLSN